MSLLLLGLLGCGSGPSAPPPARALPGLGLEAIQRAPVQVHLGQVVPGAGYSVQPLRVGVGPDFELPGVLFVPDGPGPHPAVLMAHGHFGEGKSSGEVQGPAHAFAANGYLVLALDTPGVEEGDTPGRQIHFAAGGANRLHLARAGSSAMAVQLAGLQAGLDYLERRGDVRAVAVSGASGGAVQAFYLSVVDPRPVAAILASPVPIPHPSSDGGCRCDLVDPGVPSAELLASLQDPSLWMVEDGRPPPPDLPGPATWTPIPGPHGYTEPMIQAALDFLQPILGGGKQLPSPLPHTPASVLQGAAPAGNLRQLVGPPKQSATAVPVPVSVDCAPGKGKRIAVLGLETALPGGLRACAVRFAEEGPIEAELLLARASGSLSLGLALKEAGVEGILAQGAYGPTALASGLPAAVLELPTTSEGLPWYAEGDWEATRENCVECVDSVEAGVLRLATALDTTQGLGRWDFEPPAAPQSRCSVPTEARTLRLSARALVDSGGIRLPMPGGRLPESEVVGGVVVQLYQSLVFTSSEPLVLLVDHRVPLETVAQVAWTGWESAREVYVRFGPPASASGFALLPPGEGQTPALQAPGHTPWGQVIQTLPDNPDPCEDGLSGFTLGTQ